ncbi:YneF family protein [Gemelliphila palaticanis]|uniref:YneF family protein n=1 Tax=Gemelliphila palaticanis TaxID=81950 RepID=A0ABX2SZY9_9BACL|nr:YneF family protein [Gemella palaticanis]MBF0715747.1 YneF family protein [Gemella palaticanis]NYS47677.1 YneF family protein [Gemella palaticanis]
MSTGIVILIATACFVGGAVLGFFLARKNFMNYMEKNPQLNEEVLMNMMSQMGQKPSKKKMNQMMSNMQKAQKQAMKSKK